MVQIGVGAWAERGRSRSAVPRSLRDGSEWRRAALRIHTPQRRRQPERDKSAAPERTFEQTDRLPLIRLLPIVEKPLQPFVLRESACGFLECRSAGRRCLAADGRTVTLDYQVAYCLGPRHASCAHYRRLTAPEQRAVTPRRLAYAAAAVVIVGLLALAALQAVSLGSTTAMSRMVGLG